MKYEVNFTLLFLNLAAFIAQTIFTLVEFTLSLYRKKEINDGIYLDANSCKIEVSTVFFYWLSFLTFVVRSSITSYTNYKICSDLQISDHKFEMVFCGSEIHRDG